MYEKKITAPYKPVIKVLLSILKPNSHLVILLTLLNIQSPTKCRLLLKNVMIHLLIGK